jgi:hypothetical protein
MHISALMAVYEFRFVALAANPSSSSRRIASDREDLSCCCLAQLSIADLIARTGEVVLSKPTRSWDEYFDGARTLDLPDDFLEKRDQPRLPMPRRKGG